MKLVPVALAAVALCATLALVLVASPHQGEVELENSSYDPICQACDTRGTQFCVAAVGQVCIGTPDHIFCSKCSSMGGPVCDEAVGTYFRENCV
mmetsp:Transcript_33383/g.76276  ORF Transcript_33383/g.76276 Transcript_33383/m.76276 type:complete len:94 (+) Transcript_33383:28-309(+)